MARPIKWADNIFKPGSLLNTKLKKPIGSLTVGKMREMILNGYFKNDIGDHFAGWLTYQTGKGKMFRGGKDIQTYVNTLSTFPSGKFTFRDINIDFEVIDKITEATAKKQVQNLITTAEKQGVTFHRGHEAALSYSYAFGLMLLPKNTKISELTKRTKELPVKLQTQESNLGDSGAEGRAYREIVSKLKRGGGFTLEDTFGEVQSPKGNLVRKELASSSFWAIIMTSKFRKDYARTVNKEIKQQFRVGDEKKLVSTRLVDESPGGHLPLMAFKVPEDRLGVAYDRNTGVNEKQEILTQFAYNSTRRWISSSTDQMVDKNQINESTLLRLISLRLSIPRYVGAR